MSAAPRIRLSGRNIEISHAAAFGPGDTDRFLQRVFAHAETETVEVAPRKGRFLIRLRPGDTEPRASLARLADLLSQPSVPDASLPVAFSSGSLIYRRWRGVVTLLSLNDLAPGEVRPVVPPAVLQRGGSREALQGLRRLPGIHRVRSRLMPASILIGYDPRVDPTPWIRLLERILHPPAHGLATADVRKPPSVMANTNLVLCTTGQFFYPPVIPLVSGILLVSRIPQFRKAGGELFRGKVGSPFYGCVVVLCSVATMAPFASALAEWLSLVWERRAQKQISRESGQLLDQMPARPLRLAPGETAMPRVVVAGTVMAFDGIIENGELLVEDALFPRHERAPLERKRPGDPLLSGYRVVAGEARIRPLHEEGEDRLTSVVQILSALPADLMEDPVLKAESRRIEDLSVYPNLALAGVAFMTGGLHMAGAVLHQDWIASPRISAPTEFFRDLRTALPHGVLVRTPGALKGLAESQVLLIDARLPGLCARRPRVTDIISDKKPVSRANSWASVLAVWVGDDRTLALRDLSRVSDETTGAASLVRFEAGRTTLEIEGHTVILEDVDEGHEWPSLRIRVEGEPDELLRFGPTDVSRMGKTFGQLRALGIAIAVFGEGAQAVSGVDAAYPDLDAGGLARLREDLEAKGYRSGFIAASSLNPVITRDAAVVIGPLEAIRTLDGPAIQLLGPSLEALPDLVLVARTLRLRTGLSSLRTVPSNLLCILGAFAGRFNGTMTTVIAHAGVLGVSLIQGRRIRKSHPPLLGRVI